MEGKKGFAHYFSIQAKQEARSKTLMEPLRSTLSLKEQRARFKARAEELGRSFKGDKTRGFAHYFKKDTGGR